MSDLQTFDADWFSERLPEPEQLEAFFDGDPVEAILQAVRDRAPIEMGPATEGLDVDSDPEVRKELELAVAAAKKLKVERKPELTEPEVRALHAFVHLLARPALRVMKGSVVPAPQPWAELDAARSVIGSRLRGVGRLDTHERSPAGTAWFVGKDRLITNNHVVAVLCGIELQQGWRAKLDAVLPSFNERWAGEADERPCWDPGDAPSASDEKGPMGRVEHVSFTHPDLDLALLDVVGVPSSEDRVLSIAATAPKENVYLAGYPAVAASSWKLHPALVSTVFGGTDPHVHKRVSPGRLLETEGHITDHDATTLGGSSGSPVIDLATQKVVGLHFRGMYGTENHAVAFWTLPPSFFTQHGIARS